MNEITKGGTGYLSGFTLKIIAIMTMTCDHIAEHWWYECAEVWEMLPVYMRMIGKLTFPILVYLFVEGYYHTRDRTKYLSRIAIFAAISTYPFYLADGSPWNVLFTFLVGMMLLISKDKTVDLFPSIPEGFWMAVYFLIAMFASYELRMCDWGFPGIIAIYVAGQVKNIKVRAFVPGVILFSGQMLRCYVEQVLRIDNIIIYGGCLLSIGLLLLYNGQRGYDKGWWVKYLFYIYYPAHLLVIYWIKTVYWV